MSQREFHHIAIQDMTPLALMAALGVARDVMTVLLSTAPKETLENALTVVEADLAGLRSGEDLERGIVASLEGLPEALAQVRREIVHHLEVRF